MQNMIRVLEIQIRVEGQQSEVVMRRMIEQDCIRQTEQKPERNKHVSYVCIAGSNPNEDIGYCKGPGAEPCLLQSQNIRKAV